VAATTTLNPTIVVKHLALLEYNEALLIQRHAHEQVSAGLMPNTLFFVEHPSVFTAGKRTLEEERPLDGTAVIDVDRGGKITWHGPGQIVGYPILRLAKPTEVVGFVREIESALIETCKEFGLKVQRVPGRSGVWTQDDLNPRAQELKREITAEEVLPVLERHITSTLAKVSA